jgi:hypothetical protein
MPTRSNAAEAWYPEPHPFEAEAEHQIDLLPPASLTEFWWQSLLGNLRDTLAPEKLPPLQLTSRPIDLGTPLGDQLQVAWFRTVFTNLGDVISPETLPPLELESVPVEVGELISDQLSHLWFSSLLRNLADRLVPERLAETRADGQAGCQHHARKLAAAAGVVRGDHYAESVLSR